MFSLVPKQVECNSVHVEQFFVIEFINKWNQSLTTVMLSIVLLHSDCLFVSKKVILAIYKQRLIINFIYTCNVVLFYVLLPKVCEMFLYVSRQVRSLLDREVKVFKFLPKWSYCTHLLIHVVLYLSLHFLVCLSKQRELLDSISWYVNDVVV